MLVEHKGTMHKSILNAINFMMCQFKVSRHLNFLRCFSIFWFYHNRDKQSSNTLPARTLKKPHTDSPQSNAFVHG